MDVSLRERSIRPLSRQQIRTILDRNADAINGFAQAHGIRGIRTGEQMRAGLSEQEKTTRDATRDMVNAALGGNRQIEEHRQIAVIEAVLAGDVDFLSTEDKRSALELAEKQLNMMLTTRKGTLSDTLTSDWSITMTSGQKITMATGLTEAALRTKLGDIIVRLRSGKSPASGDRDVRAQFAALADAHPAQLSSVYFALSQAAASTVKDGFLNLGIKSDEHTALTYTLSKNAETGAITVTYSEPQGFPFHFHWTATISIDGTTTTTPIMVERQ